MMKRPSRKIQRIPDKKVKQRFAKYRKISVKPDEIVSERSVRAAASDIVAEWCLLPMSERARWCTEEDAENTRRKIEAIVKDDWTLTTGHYDRIQFLVRLLYVFRETETRLGKAIFDNNESIDEERRLFQEYGDKLDSTKGKIDFTYQVVKNALGITPLPELWKRHLIPSTLGRFPWTEQDSPIEPSDKCRNQFERLLGMEPEQVEGTKVPCTVLDGQVRRLEDICYVWKPKEFMFGSPAMEDTYQWYREKRSNPELSKDANAKDQFVARLNGVNGSEQRITFELVPTRYFRSMVSNLLVQADAKWKAGSSICEDLLPKIDKGLILPDSLHKAETSNHLGVTCILLTSDFYFLLYKRHNDQLTDPGKIGFATSVAMILQRGLTPDVYIEQHGFKELGLQTMDLLPVLTDDWGNWKSPLLYLGTLLEWDRVKPEMYFFAVTKKTLQQLLAELPSEHQGDRIGHKQLEFLRDQKVIYQLDTDSRNFFLALRRSVNLILSNSQHGDNLQDAAKGGLLLLHKATAGKSKAIFAQYMTEVGGKMGDDWQQKYKNWFELEGDL